MTAILCTIIICYTAVKVVRVIMGNEQTDSSNLSLIISKLNTMSDALNELNAKADALQASLDTVQAAVTSTIQSLNDQIAALQGQLATGATAEQIAEVVSKLEATKADLEGTLPASNG